MIDVAAAIVRASPEMVIQAQLSVWILQGQRLTCEIEANVT